MMNRKIILLLALVIVFGTFLRFYRIGAENFWVDEAAVALSMKNYNLKDTAYNTVVLGQILPEYYKTGNLDFPVYYLILKEWTNFIGINEISLRTFSAIFGSLSIIMVYILSKKLFNERVGIISALIFSLNVVAVERSQQARLYSFLMLVVLAAAYFLITYIKDGKNIHLAALFLLNVIGIYVSPTFLFFFVFECVYILYISAINLIKPKGLRINKIHISFLFLFITYLPLLYRMLNPRIEGLRYAGTMTLGNLVKIFLQYNSWLYPSSELANKLNNMQYNLFSLNDWIMILPVMLIAIILFVFFVRGLFVHERKERNSFIFLAMFLAVSFTTFFIVLYKFISIFPSNVYVLYTIPAYIIIISISISKLKNRSLALVLGILFLLSLMPLSSYYSTLKNPEYSKAASYLENEIKPGDIVAVSIHSVRVPLAYYSKKLNNTYGIMNVEQLKKITYNKSSVWLVLSTKHSDPNGLIRKYFDDNYRLIKGEHFFDVELLYYTK